MQINLISDLQVIVVFLTNIYINRLSELYYLLTKFYINNNMQFIKITYDQFLKLLCLVDHKISQKKIFISYKIKNIILKKKKKLFFCKIIREIFMISIIIIL